VIVNEFMSSIVSTNAEGRLLESAEERRGEEQNNAIDRCRELWNEMDAADDCERENILRRDSALLKKDDQESVQQKPLKWE
jgi:hypothetical protein